MGRETKRRLNNLSLCDIPGTQKYLNAIVPNNNQKKNRAFSNFRKIKNKCYNK